MANTYNIKIVKTLDKQFFLDILTTMLESGCSDYWATFTTVERDEDLNVTTLVVVDSEEMARAGITTTREAFIAEHGETVTVLSVVETLRKVWEEYGQRPDAGYVWDYIRDATLEGDAGYIDGEASDFLLQMAVLDGIVYG